MTAHDIAFEMAASAVRFGAGVTREVGADLATLWLRNGKAIEELETLVAELSSQFLWCRSSWAQ